MAQYLHKCTLFGREKRHPKKPIILIFLYSQMRSIRIYLLLTGFLLSILGFEAKAQNDPKHDFMLAAQGHYGYIISHRNNMGHLVRGHIKGLEVYYSFRTDGSKTWQQQYNYPEIGLSFMHFDLANPDQLGTLECLYPFIDFKLNKQKRKNRLNLRIGIGLAYLTNPFDIKTNHKNNAIGSHMNGFVNMRLNYATMLTRSLRMDFGVGLSHASNGATNTPNLGLNMASTNLGLAYLIGNKEINYKKDSVPPSCKKSWNPSIIAVWGIKELEPPTGPKYMAFGLMVNVYKTLNHKNRIGGGVEMAYNNATKQVWEDDGVTDPAFADIVQAGVKVGYEFKVHRLSLPIDFGYYVFKKQAYNGKMFHRIGMRYMVSKHIIANVTLLTHWAKADYFEWGLGYQF